MINFKTSIPIHIFEIGGHLECDIPIKMAEILQNGPFPHTSIHIFEIGGHLEWDIITKIADIPQNCPFPRII